jgi:YidC/Oxa1 family membrane protein insertase
LLYTTRTNKEVVIQGDEPVDLPGKRLIEELNSLVITSRGGEGLDLSTYPFTLKKEGDYRLVGELILDGVLKVTKSFELARDGYLLTLDIVFENLSAAPLLVPAHQVKLGTVFPIDPRMGYKDIQFPALGAGNVQKLSPRPKKAESKSFTSLRWASATNKYFALILSPEPEDRKSSNVKVPVDKVIPQVAEAASALAATQKKSSKTDAVTPASRRHPLDEYFYSLGIGVREFTLNRDSKVIHRYSFYAGPKEYDRLKQLSQKLPGDRQYQKVMSLGWFGFVGVPLLKILKFFYKIIPNYGVAIILLTVLIKIILYPLDQKSYKSMKEMQKLQPLIAELRKKHKDDPRQAQVEQMKLFKEHKVNPMGGCLPMLLQMPVLIAMFTMIRAAVELRRAPFIFWIKDLSEPDSVWDFGVDIPIIGHTLNILPLLLVAAFIFQSRISRAAAPRGQQDPQQKIMSHMMTVFFGVIFYRMPSGLNLYFAISTVLRTVQQYFVQKKG